MRGGETDFKTEIDGAAILEDKAAGNATQPDGYAPADVVLVAAAGGRQYSDTIFRPDPATQAPAFEDRAASDVLVTRNDVFVRLDSTYYRYDRNASPSTPVALTSSGAGIVIGSSLVLLEGKAAFRVDGAGDTINLLRLGQTLPMLSLTLRIFYIETAASGMPSMWTNRQRYGRLDPDAMILV